MDRVKHFRELAAMWRGVDWVAYENYTAAADALDRLAALERDLAEARKDGARYRHIRTEAMIETCSTGKRRNRISWPTIYASDPIDGGNYRDRFDAAIDAAMGGE